MKTYHNLNQGENFLRSLYQIFNKKIKTFHFERNSIVKIFCRNSKIISHNHQFLFFLSNMSFLFLLFLFTRETFSKVNSQTHNKTPMQDYSNSDYTGKISTIHINEDYSSNEITNSKFTDCALPSGENYFFSVQK